jgi:hypothetical protein
VFQHLSEPYTRTLLEAGTALPAVSLNGPEGELLFAAGGSLEAVSGVAAALERAFGTAESAAARAQKE